MDKYEYKIKSEEIRQLIAERNYAAAAEIADGIDWRRVRSVMMLCTVSDLYKINRRYEDARDMLLLAYDKRPGGRTICYSLCELCLKTGDYVQAVEYYKEFVQVAPKDPGKYILQYKIYETQDVSLEERIQVLEELKKADYREKWAYELAYLYHRVGLASRCVEECDELILWFGTGRYVIKAMELKMLHQPLSAEQQEAYEHRFDPQEVPVVEEEPVQEAPKSTVVMPAVIGETKIFTPTEMAQVSKAVAKEPEEMEIHVKTMEVDEYSTINLQAEIAAGLKEILGEQKEDVVYPEQNAETISDVPSSENAEEILGENGQEEVSEKTTVLEGMEERPTVAEEPKKLPEEVAKVLAQGSDGQISLQIPEEPVVERQITGQMNIEDILIEWERMKKENQERHEEQIRKQVLEQTGEMFTAFEASIRDGLLEKLENDNMDVSGLDNTELTATAEEPELAVELEETGEVEELEEIQEVFEEQQGEESPVETENVVLGVASEEEVFEDVFSEEEYEEEELPKTEEEVAFEEEVESERTDESTEKIDCEPSVDKDVIEYEEQPEVEEEPSEDLAGENEDEISDELDEELEEDTADSSEDAFAETEKLQEKIRELTQEEKELYAPYIYTKSAREQLVKTLDSITMASYTGNVIITGAEGIDTLTLAKNIVNEIQQNDSNFSGKVAKISAQNLNRKDVSNILDQVKNGSLIIEHAADLNDETAKKLYKGLQQESQGMILVILDTKKRVKAFLEQHKELATVFTARVDVEPLRDDVLVAIAKKYAKSQEFSIDDFGMLALHKKIDELQTSNHAVTANEVKGIVDDAIRHAKRKTLGHFADVLFGKRYDEEDMIILGEKDFA